MHGIVLVVHVVGWSKLTWRRLLLLLVLQPGFVLTPAAEEEDGDADHEQNSTGNAYRDADYGANREGGFGRGGG
jgi:hypothetical protein